MPCFLEPGRMSGCYRDSARARLCGSSLRRASAFVAWPLGNSRCQIYEQLAELNDSALFHKWRPALVNAHDQRHGVYDELFAPSCSSEGPGVGVSAFACLRQLMPLGEEAHVHVVDSCWKASKSNHYSIGLSEHAGILYPPPHPD